jgi:5-methyltetrahydrofolate--homocysteine methyltransferase
MRLVELLSDRPLLFDGSTGTELQGRGLPAGEPPDLANLKHADLVRELHLDYIDAGSAVIETNTFGGTESRLEQYGGIDLVEKINSIAAKIALEAAGKKIKVVGSVGPLGKLIEPYGDVKRDKAKSMFEKQIRILISSGIETFVIETMMSIEEALIALEAARLAGASEVGVTLTFQRSGDKIVTAFGESVSYCIHKLEEAGADFVGSNCGTGFDDMLAVAEEIRRSTTLPVLVQPNAGIPTVENSKVKYPGSPSQFGKFVERACQIGVEMVGGCCGTTPSHIAEARRVIDSL